MLRLRGRTSRCAQVQWCNLRPVKARREHPASALLHQQRRSQWTPALDQKKAFVVPKETISIPRGASLERMARHLPQCRILLLGPPGSGKGTYASILSNHFQTSPWAKDLEHISTGDILRGNATVSVTPFLSSEDAALLSAEAPSPEGEQQEDEHTAESTHAVQKAGGLVSDEVMMPLVQQTLFPPPSSSQRYILDGFPRTVNQAVGLNQMLLTYERGKTQLIHDMRYNKALDSGKPLPPPPNLTSPVPGLDLVINLSLPHDVLVDKLVNRWTCPQCKAGYNLAHIVRPGVNMPALLPREEGQCDNCTGAKGRLIQRTDDMLDVISKRLETYESTTQPLIQFYRDGGGCLTDMNVCRMLLDHLYTENEEGSTHGTENMEERWRTLKNISDLPGTKPEDVVAEGVKGTVDSSSSMKQVYSHPMWNGGSAYGSNPRRSMSQQRTASVLKNIRAQSDILPCTFIDLDVSQGKDSVRVELINIVEKELARAAERHRAVHGNMQDGWKF